MTVECPVCDAISERVYRCDECGADLAGEKQSGRSSRGGER